MCCSSYTSFFLNLLFVEMLKCSCYLNKANVKYLKESLAKHENLVNIWKFLLFKMTSLGIKFPLYWWTSYKWSIFCFSSLRFMGDDFCRWNFSFFIAVVVDCGTDYFIIIFFLIVHFSFEVLPFASFSILGCAKNEPAAI